MAKPIIYSDGPGYVRREGPKYHFYLVIHELYENSARAKEFVTLVHNFGNLMDDKGALVLPVPSEYANIRQAILRLPWSDQLRKQLESYRHPYLILSRDELSEKDFNEDSLRFFFLTDALTDPDSYFSILCSLAEEVNNGNDFYDLYYLNPYLPEPRAATPFFKRLWSSMLLKPSFFGFGIDLKVLLPGDSAEKTKAGA